jgi:two-component system response regulator RegA
MSTSRERRRRRCVFLVVDDDDALRERLARALRRRGHSVLEARDEETVRGLARQVVVERAIVDLGLKDGSGIGAVACLKSLHPEATVVAWSGQVTAAAVARAVGAGAVAVLPKPAGVDEILGAFEDASRGGAP